jgi:hypothetical protein
MIDSTLQTVEEGPRLGLQMQQEEQQQEEQQQEEQQQEEQQQEEQQQQEQQQQGQQQQGQQDFFEDEVQDLWDNNFEYRDIFFQH